MKTKRPNYKKVMGELESQTTCLFLAMLNLAQHFDQGDTTITGHTLSYAMDGMAEKVAAHLETVEQMLPEGERPNLFESRFAIRAMAEILEELSHTSDDWDQNMKVNVATMTYTMILHAARLAEVAITQMGAKGFGFTEPDFRLL